MEFATALLALLGLPAIGSVVAFALQARREDNRRWLLNRQEAYSDLIGITTHAFWNASAWNKPDGKDTPSGEFKDEQDRALYDQVRAANKSLAKLRLMAPSLVNAAVAMHNAALKCVSLYASGKRPTVKAHGWADARSDYRSRRDAFVAAAQRDLGVTREAPRAITLWRRGVSRLEEARRDLLTRR